MEASNEFRRREPTLLAIFAAKGPAAIEFRCGDAAMTEKSYQPSRESGECRVESLPASVMRFAFRSLSPGASMRRVAKLPLGEWSMPRYWEIAPIASKNPELFD